METYKKTEEIHHERGLYGLDQFYKDLNGEWENWENEDLLERITN